MIYVSQTIDLNSEKSRDQEVRGLENYRLTFWHRACSEIIGKMKGRKTHTLFCCSTKKGCPFRAASYMMKIQKNLL